MVQVEYSHRIICDRYFIEWLSKQTDKKLIISRLMHIKASSKYQRKRHSLILASEKTFCLKGGFLNDNVISACFKQVTNFIFLKMLKDSITKNIIFAIYVNSEKPYKCFIFTDPSKIENYKSNRHYQKLKEVTVKCNEDVRIIIDDFFEKFKEEREFARGLKSR